jgi:hypothetical protein
MRELLVPCSMIHKVLHKRLRLCAYKVQLVQQLKPGDGMARQHFAEEILDRIDLDDWTFSVVPREPTSRSTEVNKKTSRISL